MVKQRATIQLSPTLHVALFEDGSLTITDTSNDLYLPVFTNLDAQATTRLANFLMKKTGREKVSQQMIDELFPLAVRGDLKKALWQRYQGLVKESKGE